MQTKRKTMLVTGGAGFVGGHLSEALLAAGSNVVILDDFSNGTMDNLTDIKDKVVILRQDISQPFDKLAGTLKDFKFDGIFNLACFPRSLSLKDPFRDLEVNAKGTLNILELARLHKAKMVFTSNSGIYGDPDYLPMDEKHPDKPTTPYDANKLVSEYYMKIYYRIHGVPIGICRLASVYGDRQRIKEGWKPVIPEFADKLMKGEPATICWDGEQTRDLIYVKDVVQGLTKLMAAPDTGAEVFILGTGVETSINQIYRIISRELGKQIEPRRAAKTPGDIARMRLSSAKAEKTFGFKPQYNLEQGIKNYLSWLKRQ